MDALDLSFFPGGFGCLDYSGFDRQNWPPRDGKDHRKVGLSMQSFSSPSERDKKESSAGLRYCSHCASRILILHE